MKKVNRQIWDAILMPDIVIDQVNSLSQGQLNDLKFLDCKKHPIGEIEVTGVYSGGNEDPHLEFVKP